MIYYSKINQAISSRFFEMWQFLKFTVICVNIRCPVAKAAVPKCSSGTRLDQSLARLVALVVFLAFAVSVVPISFALAELVVVRAGSNCWWRSRCCWRCCCRCCWWTCRCRRSWIRVAAVRSVDVVLPVADFGTRVPDSSWAAFLNTDKINSLFICLTLILVTPLAQW